MSLKIDILKQNDYLLVTVSGKVVNTEEHKLLVDKLISEIIENRVIKMVLNIEDVEFEKSVLSLLDIVDYYGSEHSGIFKSITLAVVLKPSMEPLAEVWLYAAKENGYNCKIFNSDVEAITFILNSE